MNIPEEGYKAIFYKSNVAKLILCADAPHYTILDVNDAYLASTNSTREALIGQPVFTVFPQNPTDSTSRSIERTVLSFEEMIKTKKPHTLRNYRYDIPISGNAEFEERYWTSTNTPILNDNGEVAYFIHSPQDVTAHYYLEIKAKAGIDALKKQRKQLYSVFTQAPVGIGIFLGPDFVVDMVNPALSAIYGKSIDELHGKPIFDVLVQAKGLGFEEALDHVRKTGEHYEGKNVEIPLIRNGILEKVYVDFAYHPFYNDHNTISGVIAVAIEVTEQVHFMHKLEEAEERARLAADVVDLGIFDLNILNGEMITSQRFAAIFGFDHPVSREEYVKAFHPDDLLIRRKAHEYAIENGSMNYEARIIWNDKSIHWIRVEGKVIYDKKVNPIRIIGTLLDITTQKRDKEQQKKLITLVENGVDLMSILNLDGSNSYINAAGIKMLGFTSLTQAINTPISEFYSAEDYDLIKREVLPAVLRKGMWTGNMKVIHNASGEVFPVSTTCIRISDSNTAKPIGVGIVMRDLRPEMMAKQALADSEELLRNITSASPTALWMSDEQGNMIYVNETWTDWCNNTFEDNLGDGWIDAIHGEDRALVKSRFETSIVERIQFEVEFRIIDRVGKLHWCVAIGDPQYREHGVFTGLIGSCTDITEHKELQNQKDNFIGIASHELKTPVTSLKGYTQVMARVLNKKGLDMEVSMMQKMDAQLNRLTSLINDLLDVTKINSGKLQYNSQEFELQPMLSELVEDLQRTSSKHHLKEIYKPTGTVYADKDRIEQVVINLITNAIKYSPESDQVIIRCEQIDEEIVVSIQDFGVGISKSNQFKVFEQFYRVSTEKQHTFPGVGLGLYISAEIIKRTGGRIWVTSEENKGSCFYFSLPIHKP
ncbi:PAS domain S-box protein [Pedobacter sp.]|uniref:PAS domain S-box protein n=1 Tax=Pedobacter sp. TaxID=1411316 RepID=UPI003D7FE63B